MKHNKELWNNLMTTVLNCNNRIVCYIHTVCSISLKQLFKILSAMIMTDYCVTSCQVILFWVNIYESHWVWKTKQIPSKHTKKIIEFEERTNSVSLLSNDSSDTKGSLYQNSQLTSLNNLWKFVGSVHFHNIYRM